MSRILLALVALLSSHLSAKEINRIIALSPSSVEMLFEIGVGDRIIGTVDHADFPEEAKKIRRLGNYVGVQIETIVSLQPDLIVAWKTGNKQADLKKLASLGLNLVYVDPKSLEAVSKEMRRLGEIIGVEKQAKVAADRFDIEYARVKKLYANEEKVRVFYQLWSDPIRTVGSNSWVQSLIEECNGQNIFEDSKAPYPVVSVESILVKDPQVMLMASHSDARQSKKKLWNKWTNVSAVKNNLFEVVESSKHLRAGPRAVEGLALMCESIDKARMQ